MTQTDLSRQRFLRWVAFILCTLLLCSGCKERFTVRGEATRNFPVPWSEAHQATGHQVLRSTSPVKSTVEETELSAELQRVAVLELINRAPNLVTVDEVNYLTNELRTVASYLPRKKYLVLTKESLEVLIDPNLKLEDCVGSCEVEVGRLVGAKWIITGEVMRFGESLRVSLKLHQTESGQFLKGASLKGKTVENLEEELHRSALSLIKNVSLSWGKRLDKIAPGDLKKQLEYLRTHTP